MADWGFLESVDTAGADELRQRLHSLVTVIARAPVPIAIAHDPSCRFISANRALATLLDLPEQANISLTPSSGTPPYRIQRNGVDVPPAELPMQYAIAQRTAVSNEIEIVRADGTVLYVQNDVEPLFDTRGEIYGCVSVCVDLTFRKRAELALRDADRRKDEFLATLSHELRNPLAPIRTAIEVMRLARGDAEVVEHARTTMERQVLHLVRLTDDLLDVARITQNKVELRRTRIDLRTVVASAVESSRAALDAQGQVLEVDLPDQPLWAEADATRLAQAVSNLLNNAVKYTGRGGRIVVAARATGGVAAISVEDTGPGIEPAMLERIFDMFTQLRAHRDRAQGGLGIGLTLARRLAELHGGTIAAHSEGPGRGSRFVMAVPLAADVAATAAASPSRAGAPAVCRVLIAEDNADAAEMLRVMLELNGHEVYVAADGHEAIELAAVHSPQIAFIDIGMPGMDGLATAQLLRQRFGDAMLLVALTGWGQDEDKRRSREAGFDHHLIKPPEPEVLERLIAAALERGSSPRTSR